MSISLITTVKNEGEGIAEFLDSIAAQTEFPKEIIIVDGGSSDDTVEKIKNYSKFKILCFQENVNIAAGRNIAIRHASHEIIAVTDAGCRLEPDWVEKITNFPEGVDAVVGNYRPVVDSLFDACQYSVNRLFKSDDNLDNFQISSRSLAFKKRVWEEIGGYPEWLRISEDAYFHEQMLQRRYKIVLRQDAIVEWAQRPNLKQIFKQFFRYMEGEAIGRLHPGRNILRFMVYALGVFLLMLSASSNQLYLLILLIGFFIYVLAPFSNFRKLGRYPMLSWALLIIPFLLVFIDVAKISGYISGLLKRGATNPDLSSAKTPL